jgi:hypothetical protein
MKTMMKCTMLLTSFHFCLPLEVAKLTTIVRKNTIPIAAIMMASLTLRLIIHP